MADKRSWTPDLIRVVAVVEVLAVHAFLNTTFYSAPMAGGAMVVGTLVRTALMTCVPLFLLLSGYLCGGWQWSFGYYRRIFRILSAYVLASLACLIFRAAVLGGSWNLLRWVRDILNFTAAPYCWYIEMYLGLFLLIPFVNAALKNLPFAGRAAMTASLFLLSVVPSAVNLWRYTPINVQLLPDWWEVLYPLAYYCMGALLRERPLVLHPVVSLGGITLCSAAGAAVHLVGAAKGPFPYADITYWGGLLTAISAVLLFSLLLRSTGEGVPQPIRRGVETLSRLSLTVYLISYIPDQLIAAAIRRLHLPIGLQVLTALACVPLCLAASMVLAWLLRWPEKQLTALGTAVWDKITPKPPAPSAVYCSIPPENKES